MSVVLEQIEYRVEYGSGSAEVAGFMLRVMCCFKELGFHPMVTRTGGGISRLCGHLNSSNINFASSGHQLSSSVEQEHLVAQSLRPSKMHLNQS